MPGAVGAVTASPVAQGAVTASPVMPGAVGAVTASPAMQGAVTAWPVMSGAVTASLVMARCNSIVGVGGISSSLLLQQSKSKFFDAAQCEHQRCGQWRAGLESPGPAVGA